MHNENDAKKTWLVSDDFGSRRSVVQKTKMQKVLPLYRSTRLKYGVSLSPLPDVTVQKTFAHTRSYIRTPFYSSICRAAMKCSLKNIAGFRGEGDRRIGMMRSASIYTNQSSGQGYTGSTVRYSRPTLPRLLPGGGSESARGPQTVKIFLL